MSTKQYYVYILTNTTNNVFYIGITNDLVRRVSEHKGKVVEGFTKEYNITKLVYFEMSESAEGAIQREKQLKAGSRRKKMQLIEKDNPLCHDLYEEIF